jgi:hypothetical protein
MKTDQKLKEYMLANFYFDGLKEAGFYKGIRKNDYHSQAAKVCKFFSLKSVYEYSDIGKGVGYHLSIVAAEFECPICTCKQMVPDVEPGKTFKCAGCKRKLRAYPTWNDFEIVTEDKYKEEVKTHY